MKISIIILTGLLCCSFPLFAEGEMETSSGNSNQHMGNSGSETASILTGVSTKMENSASATTSILTGVFTIIDSPPQSKRPGIIDDDLGLVRLEGDLARQLAYGSSGQTIRVKGYPFPLPGSPGDPPRFVVTEIVALTGREE